MVPVMLAGTILHRKRYSLLEYLCMLMIGAGVGLFARKSSSTVTTKLASPNVPLGYFLCFLNMSFDGYTNAYQDEVCGSHPRRRRRRRARGQQDTLLTGLGVLAKQLCCMVTAPAHRSTASTRTTVPST